MRISLLYSIGYLYIFYFNVFLNISLLAIHRQSPRALPLFKGVHRLHK